MSVFRIVVADDHPIVRFGVSSLLGARAGWEVCGEAADGRDAIEKCRQLKPDLLVLDIGMPQLNGVDAARQILKDNPALRILVFTDVNSDQVIRDCLEAGIRGWVFKSDGTDDLTIAVEALQRHKCIFGSRVSSVIADAYLQRNGTAATAPRVAELSLRERQVLQLICEGKSTKEVAVTLDLKVKTAETHRANLMRKLQLHSIAELVLYAVRNHVVDVNAPAVLRFPNARRTERRPPLRASPQAVDRGMTAVRA